MQKIANPVTKSLSVSTTETDEFVTAWEKISNTNQQNEELDSFLAGRENGMKDSNRILTNQLYANIQQAQKASQQLYGFLYKKNLKPLSIHVKSELITVFHALVIVEKEAFLSDEFREAFSIARKLSQQEENANFCINFSFMANADNIDYECMSTDGYFLKYEKKDTVKTLGYHPRGNFILP